MGAQVVDYRVSTLIVLCKDCGHDVGLYPARHKCHLVERPALPALPAQYSNQRRLNLTGSSETNAKAVSSGSSSSPSPDNKWSPRVQNNRPDDENEESVYFNNFASNLPEKNEASGKNLWGKIRQNEKWKQLSEKNEKPRQAGKLWGKLIQATQNMADKIPLREDRGADSDEDDWEGETHVSRILREHYEQKRLRLPEWLFDANAAVSQNASSSNRKSSDQMSPVHQQREQQTGGPVRTPSRRRLWEQNPEDAKSVSTRERERQELRQAQPPIPPLNSENRSRYSNRDHQHAEDRNANGGRRYSNNKNNFEGDQYSNRNQHYDIDHGRRNQPRNDSSNQHDDRSRHYSQGRDRYDTPPQRRGSRDQPHYYGDDHRYTQNQASTRGYNHNESRSNRYEQGAPALDDYYTAKNETQRAPSQYRDHAAAAGSYHSPPDMSRREPLIKSSGRRYGGNDPNYF